jgi:bacteriophage exclusion system BrxA-like protein
VPNMLCADRSGETLLKYSATITAGSLKVTESRLIADLLLHQIDPIALQKALIDTNVLQAATPLSAIRIGGLIHARLSRMGPGLWRMVRDGTTTTSTQACLAAAIKHSALLGDFMDLVLRDFYRQHIEVLPKSVWEDYLIDCRARSPEMPTWHESTQRRLRSTVYQTLAQAGYIESTRTRRLQTVHIAHPLIEYLRDNDEDYVLRCIEVSP